MGTVGILVKFLNNTGICGKDIFCTSIDNSLEVGKHFIEQIKNNVRGSKIVIYLLSERFFLSYFCLAELGSAWALNQNIFPIIVPPISLLEYNKTPLLGIQALNISDGDFADKFIGHLAEKRIIPNDCIADREEVKRDFNKSVKKEIGTLRRDPNGFYMARIIDKYTYLQKAKKQIPCRTLGGKCHYSVPQTLAHWRLNGLLEMERDSSITEHWIYIGGMNFSSNNAKALFKVSGLFEEGENYKVFSTSNTYELP